MVKLHSPHLEASFSPLGARLVSLIFDGVDLVMGPAHTAKALASDIYAGAITGRCAGRIRGASFRLEGQTVLLAANIPPHHLHGGFQNFANQHWEMTGHTVDTVTFHLVSPAGAQGYPGTLSVTARYHITDTRLQLDLAATTTAPTIVNLTNHAYWNLAGEGTVLNHALEIPAAHYLPLDGDKLPLGILAEVAGSVFDFRQPRPIARAYDHCFSLEGPRGKLQQAVRLRDPSSGRCMEVFTSEIGVQIYTADHFGPDIEAKNTPLSPYCALAIEPQNYPDAVNHPDFPSAILYPDAPYHHQIIWQFSQSG